MYNSSLHATRSFGIFFVKVVFASALAAAFFFIVPPAHAAIDQSASPIEAFFESPLNVGGGTVFPYIQFRLSQTSGSDTLSKIGVQIFASSTINQGEISRVSLWQESGTKHGLQLDQDTFIAGAASTSPMVDGTLIVLTPTAAVSIGSSPTEFFIVASTTGTSGIVNSHGFDMRMQEKYASTTAGLGVGTAFTPGRKVLLSQTAPLKISEVRLGTASNVGDEFIELYNTGDASVNLSDLPLNLHAFYASGSSSPIALTYYRKVIPPHGFFLIGSQINYSGSTPLDAVFATTSSNVLKIDGGFSIATSSSLSATSTKIDMICWGSQPGANCENADTASDVPADLNLEDGRTLERLARGYADATSTASTLASGGSDSSRGNSIDRNDNSEDFVIQTPANPQNSFSPAEFAFGGGGGGSESLRVQGSYPSNGQINVPVDLPSIGFGFTQPASTSTVNTTNVTLALTAGGSTLCSSVTYNPFPGNNEPQGKCVLSAQLSSSTSYTFTASSSVQNVQGSALDQDQFQAGNQNYTAVFTTGGAGQTFTNTTPPAVVGTSPFPGSQNVPTSLAVIAVEFNQRDMNTATLSNSTITLQTSSGTNVALSSFLLSTSTGRNVLTFAPGALAANTVYVLTVGTGVRNTNSIGLPMAYTTTFTTGSGSDSTAPTVIGILPTASS
ncbi:MAG: Ig-like domain-containing protein, partial [Candidatus Harrisonbacteria bacterium]|nr:Ig-like domain-containing protein [Candidatus Harrisonbacteria bacterium]